METFVEIQKFCLKSTPLSTNAINMYYWMLKRLTLLFYFIYLKKVLTVFTASEKGSKFFAVHQICMSLYTYIHFIYLYVQFA